jgi:DNA-binding SARP family transcriptional activator
MSLTRTSVVRFGILGPLTVHLDGEQLSLGPVKQQLVLALLLCRANSSTPVELLFNALWQDGEPPRTARKNLQVYVASLRKLLRDVGSGDRITHGIGGYQFRATEIELDALRFTQLTKAARRAALSEGPAAAAAILSDALRIWRGPMLDGLSAFPAIRDETERMNRRFLTAFEDWAEAEVASGNARSVADRVCEMAGQHPMRERLRGIQMTALYLSGRQSEALSAFDELRQSLALELGLEPGGALRQLYHRMLSGELAAAAVRPATRGTPPPDLSDFVGRGAVIEQLTGALSRGIPRLAVLTGAAGTGKTAIAVHVARHMADSFPDGTLFLSLRADDGTPLAASTALAAAMRAGGLPGPFPEDLREAMSAWQAWVTQHRVLLVLDDFSSQAAVQALLPVAGGSAAILTGRSWLAGLDGAARISVPPFSIAEGMELLARILADGRVSANPAAAESVVRSLGLLPAAVRAAGRKLAFLRHLPLAEFAARLTDSTVLLDELTVGGGALRRRFAMWLSDLPDAEQAGLRRLGSMRSPSFTLDQAVTLLSADVNSARWMLESLIEANAIVVPQAEVSAHAVLYEIPPMLHSYLRVLPAEPG